MNHYQLLSGCSLYFLQLNRSARQPLLKGFENNTSTGFTLEFLELTESATMNLRVQQLDVIAETKLTFLLILVSIQFQIDKIKSRNLIILLIIQNQIAS